MLTPPRGYLDFRDSLWARALAAADFAFALDFGLLSTLEAALAAALEVTFAGALVWDNALAAAFFALLEPAPASVLEALVAAFVPVVFFPIICLLAGSLTLLVPNAPKS